jgi:hypothetical protein
MIDVRKNDKEFKEAIGAFIIAFSELEYGLAFCKPSSNPISDQGHFIVKK